MITAVRIKNLRSLADTGFIEIKPITLLLGANSTGKSTFLRSFPLFTQSVNKNLRGPISRDRGDRYLFHGITKSVIINS